MMDITHAYMFFTGELFADTLMNDAASTIICKMSDNVLNIPLAVTMIVQLYRAYRLFLETFSYVFRTAGLFRW